MKFYFHPDAKEEFDGAVEFYEHSQPGLGLEFAEEIYATIARVINIRMLGQNYPKTPAVALSTGSRSG